MTADNLRERIGLVLLRADAGQLTPEDGQWLEDCLRNSPSAVEAYLEHIELLSALLSTTRGVPSTAGAVPPAANRDALLAADRAFDAATAEKKLDGFSSFLADNASTLRADRPVLQGKAAVQQEWKGLLENKSISLRWQPISAEIAKSGDLGYTRGTYVLTATDPASQKAVTEKGRFVTIFRKEADGSWKAVQHISNADAPAAPSK